MGPVSILLLPNKLTQAQLAKIEADLLIISIKVVKSELWDWEFWVNNTHPVDGEYVGEGRPFGIQVQDPDIEPQNLSLLQAQFGFEPQQSLQLDALCNDKVDHTIMGVLLLHFAKLFDGVINFGGALLPPLPEWLWETENWSDIKSYFYEMVAGMSGNVVSMEYEIDDGITWAYHVADAPFLQAWLEHPNFHMIK